jgi:hypothetical protein
MNNKLSTYLSLFWIFLLAFSSCKKDDINTGSYTPQSGGTDLIPLTVTGTLNWIQ